MNDTAGEQMTAFKTYIPTSTATFDQASDSAFQRLQDLTAKMLQVADNSKKLDLQEDDLGPTLTSTRETFQALVNTYQGIYKEMSDQAAALTQQESYNDRLKLDIKAKSDQIKNEQPGILDMVRTAVQSAGQNDSGANQTRGELSNAQNDANICPGQSAVDAKLTLSRA